MTISRRDTIIIAVLINTGLLSLLFMTAMQFDEEPITERKEIASLIVDNHENIPISLSPPVIETPSVQRPFDEVDQVLQHYSSTKETPKNNPAPTRKVETPSFVSSDKKVVEITVKRGDFLEKIARANGTTVDEIKRINHLPNDNLVIGQILRVPVPSKKDAEKPSTAIVSAPPRNESRISASPSSSEPVFYVIKSGDNPWKIAKQFQIRYEEILVLNGLNEESARNLKVGDRIRIK